jgi:phage shock protein PspC (stress-responsive transcriptional regulator)
MRKVTTINLNNNAYQIDEEGYEALRRYLENAARALATNPDREEILSDLEQAIADKCRLTMGPHKTVVSTAEIERILQEMGPVAGSTDEAGKAESVPAGMAAGAGAGSGAWRSRRLYRIREGQIWGGVCTGLSAYLGADVAWIRLAAILLTIFTGFIPGFIVYVAFVLIVPVASTGEELSAAHGQPFNAQELIDRIKKKHDDFRNERRSRRMNRTANWWTPPTTAQPAPGYTARITGGLMLPVLTVLSAVWFAAMAVAAYSVWWGYQHAAFRVWPPGAFNGDPDVPRWLAIIAIIAIYALIALPLGAGRRAALYYANGGRLHGWADAWSGLLWLAIVAVILLVAASQMPELHQWLRSITSDHWDGFAIQPPAWHHLTHADVAAHLRLTMPWLPSLDVADGDDLVAALAARGSHLDAIALLLAYKGAGDR